ncbi:anti-sigma factor [Herbiconiux sp. YIM B11900]|uniref:anti-sigma factor n=1 Tax=Herbiconiux sp. YIM B11900 TaxID=3404131 RepID=UPI003F8648B6
MTGPHDDQNDPRLLTGAYALDAVSSEDAEAFERAAARSDVLREEADELAATASLLGLAADPVTPSERMKAELMAKLAITPQLPAVESTTVQDARASAPETVVADAPAAPAADATVTELAAPASGAAEQRARVRWFARPVGLLTAVAAAAALFVGGGFVGSAIINSTTNSTTIDASAAQLAAITAADDVQRETVQVTDGGTATLVWSNDLGRSAVLVDGLAGLPDGKVYEAWYINAGGAIPAGTFTASADGTTWHVLDGALTSGDAIGVTVEPAGGSTAPTTDPILVVQSA